MSADVVAETTLQKRTYRELPTKHFPDLCTYQEPLGVLTEAQQRSLARALASFPVKLQRLVLCVADGDTIHAAAQQLGVPSSTAYRWIAKVTPKLKVWLEGHSRYTHEERFLAQCRREDMDRRAPAKIRHCPKGQERCKTTGVCPFA